MHVRSRRSDLVAAALSARMLGLLALLVVAVLVFGRLGAWQLDRATQQGERAAERSAAAAASAAPQALDDVLLPQSAVAQDDVGTAVVVRGRYAADDPQYVVPQGRPGGADAGGLVLAPFVVAEGAGAGAILPVVRGWVAGDVTETVVRLSPGGDLGVPTGDVAVTGYVASSEAALAAPDEGVGSVPGRPGVLGSISSGQLANLWGSPIYGGYVRLSSSEPAEDAALVPAAPPEPGPATPALRNLAYAAQWWIFGGFAVLLWVRLVRDDALRRAEARG